MTTTRIPHDLSQFDRELIEHLDTHVQSEKGVIELYDTLSYDEHPYVSFVAQLIREDEARHHRLFVEWIESIKAMAELRETSDGIPHIDHHKVDPETINMVDRLLAFEREDLATSRGLRREIREVKTTTLWGVLMDVVIADTKKHIKLLKFLSDRLAERELELGERSL
jgi:hypothetical protein